MEPENPPLDAFVLSLARSSSPRLCFVPTASGDSEGYLARFYRGFAALPCRPTDLQLFRRTVDDLGASSSPRTSSMSAGATRRACWPCSGRTGSIGFSANVGGGGGPVRPQRRNELLV